MRYCGLVGYVAQVEQARGVYVPEITTKKYYGDVLKDNRKWDKGVSVNDNLTISNKFSIVGDAYAFSHLGEIAFIEWMGTRWKVSNIEINRPRMILSVGGLWSGSPKET